MQSRLRIAVGLTALVLAWCLGPSVQSQQPSSSTSSGPTLPQVGGTDKKFEDFDKLVKGAKEYDGLFKLHHKDGNLYAEIRADQLDKPLLCPMAVARGGGLGGLTLNFEEQWVLLFKRVGDRVHLIRRNIHFKAKAGSPASYAVETTYTDSVLLALKIHSINTLRNAVVLNLNDIFMSDFAQLGLGSFDPSRSTWHKIKAFSKNIEIEVAATFSGFGRSPMPFAGGDSVIDARGNTVVIHYGLVHLPDDSYRPRLADDRVGYFLSAVKDFSSDNQDTCFVRYINRWRLERVDGSTWKEGGKLAPPKKKIVFWIEKSVPDEFRAPVREGILEWNKAFEKVGFRDAIEVRQQENEDFDPEDINYNTFRWITTDLGFAMGPSRANPLTGEILDADIIFDSSMVKYWKQEQKIFGSGAADWLEASSPIQAYREGHGLLNHPLLLRGHPLSWNDREQPATEAELADLRSRLLAIRKGMCQCAAHRKYELGLAAMALHEAGQLKPGEKIPDELINQAIKEVVMHEVGHTLGLRHNFKSSTMLKNEQLHDTTLTRKQGLTGSVMDYAPVNLAPKGVKQGDYFSATIGPYDYWAISYAYKPLTGGTEGEAEELKKMAARGAEFGLDYGTDEDMMTPDPFINVWDLGADPMKYGMDRMQLAQDLLKELADRVVDKGEGHQRTRLAFTLLLQQYGNAAHLVSRFVGGACCHRDHKGDANARDPLVPVPPARQREALKLLQDNILTERPFQFPPQLLRRLAADRWLHWGNEYALLSGVEYPVYQRILAIQRIVLGELLSAGTLRRIQDNGLKYDKEDNPLTVAEVFRSLSDAIWAGDPGTSSAKKNGAGRIVRRNLQREYLGDLIKLVLGPRPSSGGFSISFLRGAGGSSVPPDARSLARLHLRDIDRKIETALKQNNAGLDDTGRAHLEECHERITRALGASMQINEP